MNKLFLKKALSLLAVVVLGLTPLFLTGCGETQYTVTYFGNGNTSGSVPVDGTQYDAGMTATVMENTGNLAKTGYTFGGWNGNAEGTSQDYAPGSEMTMNFNRLLYAKWIPDTAASYHARLEEVKLKPIETVSPSFSIGPSWDLLHWDNRVKLDRFVMTFGQYGTELPSWSFKDGYNLQQGVMYDDITELEAKDLPLNEYTGFTVESNSNYFTRMLSSENTLSFKASFYIRNFAQPNYENPDVIESIGTIGGSTVPMFETENYPVPSGANEVTVEFTEQILNACGFEDYNVQFIFSINRGTPSGEQLFNVTYNGNGATENVPTDSINYYTGSYATVKPQGSMVYEGHFFTGWNTAANGLGTSYYAENLIEMTQNVTLYAQWADSASANIKGKSIKDAELNGSTYLAANSVQLTENYSYGMQAWLYVDTDAHETLKIIEFVTFEILPYNAEVTYVFLKDGDPIAFDEDFTTPVTTSQQVVIQIKVMYGEIMLDAVQIYIRKLPA